MNAKECYRLSRRSIRSSFKPPPPPFQTMGEICLLVTQMIYLDEPLPAESQEKWDAVRAQEKYTYEPAEFRLL